MLDYATHEATKSRDCIFYEKPTLPIFKEHCKADKAPERDFEGHRGFATLDNEADMAEDADPTNVTQFQSAPNIPLTSPFQTPTYIPVSHFDPDDTTREAHNYNSTARQSPDAELPPGNSSQDTIRTRHDIDDDVVKVTSFHDYDRLIYEKTNETGLCILELAVEVRHTSPKEPTTVRQALSDPDRVLVDLELIDLVGCRPGVGQPGECSTWWGRHVVVFDLGGRWAWDDTPGMYRKESRGKFILLVFYVDDLLYTDDDKELPDQFEEDIKEKLEVTIYYNDTQFLGLNITQSATSIHLSAAKYVETLAKKFAIAPINLTTPFAHLPLIMNPTPRRSP
ncbi:unnamed protein product [Closterium sp. NIES-53]